MIRLFLATLPLLVLACNSPAPGSSTGPSTTTPTGLQHWHGVMSVDDGAAGSFAMTCASASGGLEGMAVVWQDDGPLDPKIPSKGVAPLDVGEVSGSLESFTVTKSAYSILFTGTVTSNAISGSFKDATSTFHGTFALTLANPIPIASSVIAPIDMTQRFAGQWTNSANGASQLATLHFMQEDAAGYFATWAGTIQGLSIDSAGSVLVSGHLGLDAMTFQLVGHEDGSNAAMAVVDKLGSAPVSLGGRVAVVAGATLPQSGTFQLGLEQ